MAKGKIVKVSGPVVDVEFPESLPAIYNALTVEYKVKNQPAKLTLEVQQDLGDNVVRTISMAGTEGLKRGFEVIDTGGPISMPVGEAVMAFPEPALQRRPSVYRTRRQAGSCGWRIVISPMIPQNFPSCYYSSMRNLAVLVIHLIATLARLLGPGGVRSLVAESLLLKHQLLIVNRSRQRSPNLSAGDRILAGLLALLVRPTRLLRSAIALKPSTLLGLHKVLSKQKYRMLFSTKRRRKRGPKGASVELIHAVVEMKQRNPRVESRGSSAENKPVTARTFINFRGPQALIDN